VAALSQRALFARQRVMLLELVIALAIAGLVMAIPFLLFRSARRR
jgi:hypothetical protein